jgi:hypothetical protein
MENIFALAFIAIPIVVGFVVWLVWRTISIVMRAAVRARNWWRRVRKQRLVGQRIEPTL